MHSRQFLSKTSNCFKKISFKLLINEIVNFFIKLMNDSQVLFKSFIEIYFKPIFIITCIYIVLIIIHLGNVFKIAGSLCLLIMVILKILHKTFFFNPIFFSIAFFLVLIFNLSIGNLNVDFFIIVIISVIAFYKEKIAIFIVMTLLFLIPIPFIDEFSSILLITVFGLHFIFYSRRFSKTLNTKTKFNFSEISESNINIVLLNQEKASNSYFAGIVHDLRNPVGAVSNTFESLLESSRINDEERNNIQSALFCCKIQLMLINNLLDMSKIHANKFELNAEEFNLPKLIYMIIKMEDHVCIRKKLSLKRNILNTLPRVVLGDQNRITQILLNIIGNSIKFTSQGFVKISCAWVLDLNSIDFSDESMKGSLLINRKLKIDIHDFTKYKKSSSVNINKDYSPDSDDICDDCSIQQNISKYHFEINTLKSKSKLIQFTKTKNSPKNISQEPYMNNDSELFLPCKFLSPLSPKSLSQEKKKEENKMKEQKIKDFFNIPEINNYSNDGILYIEVVDTGEGIKKEEQTSLFKPFSQGSSKVKSLGTGLGLWISMKLIEIMGGKMKMYSEYGRGTVTKISIPLKIIKLSTLLFFEDTKKEKLNRLIDSKCSPDVPRHSQNEFHSFQVFIIALNIDILKILFPIESKFKENHSQAFFFFIKYSELKKMKYSFNNINKRTIFLFIISEDSDTFLEEINNIQNTILNSQTPVAKEIYALVSKNH